MANYGTTNAILASVPTFPPITNEFSVGTRLQQCIWHNGHGQETSDTNSATSILVFQSKQQCHFLDDTDNNDLFAVFGHVVRGTNVLNEFIGRIHKQWNPEFG